MINQRLRATKRSRRDFLRASVLTAASLAGRSGWGQVSTATDQPVRLGLNLAPIRYWGSERPFNNLFLASSPHVSLKQGGKWNDGGPLDLDANGWIQRFQPGQSAAFMIDLKRGHKNTVYEVLYQGGPNAVRIQDGQGNTFLKNRPDARLTARVTSPIRNVVVRERGMRDTSTFATPFVERCRQFAVLRFMDWQGTNSNRSIEWSSRVTDKHYTQAGVEVALEYLVELCNVTSSALWYCVHHRADDAFVSETARFLKEHLSNEQPIYLEHSNEVWNSKFPQYPFARQAGNGDWLAYHVQRTAAVARLFRAEGLQVVSVLGLQSAGSWAAAKALARGVPDDINATAIAPYFGGRICRQPQLVESVLAEGVERVLSECQKDIHARRAEIRQHREIAARHNLQLIGYEGGQHLVTIGKQRKNQQLVRLLTQANRHPAMYDLYQEYLSVWNAETNGGLMCLYYSCGEPGQSGSWGLMEYDGQPLSEAPKYRAVAELLAKDGAIAAQRPTSAKVGRRKRNQ